MVKTGTALLLALVALACDGGGDGGGGSAAKAEFDAYEKAVKPLLEEDERLRREWDDGYESGAAAKSWEALGVHVRSTQLTAYPELESRARTIRPESGELRAVHSLLLRYCSDRLGMLRAFEEWERLGRPVRKKLTGAIQAVDDGQQAVAVKVQAVDAAVKALQRGSRPDKAALVEKIRNLMKDDPVLAKGFFDLVRVWLDGQIDSVQFRKALEEKAKPAFAKQREKLGEILRILKEAEEGALREVLDAIRAYYAAVPAYLNAIDDLLSENEALGEGIMKDLAPKFTRVQYLRVQTKKDLADYRNAARAYRAGL